MECDICGKELAAYSLRLHLETQHDIHSSFVLSRDLINEDRPPVSCRSIFSIATGKYACPVPGCEGTAGAKYGMRRHFGFLHPLDLVKLPGEGSYPKCKQYGVHVNPATMGNQSSKTCKNMHATKLQRKVVSDSAKALEAKFFAYGVELERVEVFKYLGRLIAYDDEDN